MADTKRNATPDMPALRPRNPHVAEAINRHGGRHGRSRKAERQQARQRFERVLGALLEGDTTEFEID